MSGRTVLFAAGGTGGHVFPALALAEAMTARGWRVVVATDNRGKRFEGAAETRLVAASSLSGGVGAKLKGTFKLLHGVMQAWALIRSDRPDVVVGFGGFPSLPALLAAFVLRRPVVLHEQNAVLGRVNRLFAKRACAVAVAFERVKGADGAALRLTGNPVRAAIRTVRPYAAPENVVRLLVTGGSQGARVLSDAIPGAVASLPEALRARIEIAQQCRPEDLERVAAAYRDAGVAAETSTFFDDMAGRLAKAHLVIGRAGASTVAELAVSGRPSLLIPFAAAMDDHQTANAMALVEAGGAWTVPESEATPERLRDMLAAILGNSAGLTDAALAAKASAPADAAAALADLVEDVAQPRSSRAQGQAVRGMLA